MSETKYSPSWSFVVPTCHSQQCVPEGASAEGLVLVIVLVLFQLLPGFYLSQIKCESIEPYGRAVLEQKARTVTNVQI